MRGTRLNEKGSPSKALASCRTRKLVDEEDHTARLEDEMNELRNTIFSAGHED